MRYGFSLLYFILTYKLDELNLFLEKCTHIVEMFSLYFCYGFTVYIGFNTCFKWNNRLDLSKQNLKNCTGTYVSHWTYKKYASRGLWGGHRRPTSTGCDTLQEQTFYPTFSKIRMKLVKEWGTKNLNWFIFVAIFAWGAIHRLKLGLTQLLGPLHKSGTIYIWLIGMP